MGVFWLFLIEPIVWLGTLQAAAGKGQLGTLAPALGTLGVYAPVTPGMQAEAAAKCGRLAQRRR
jgi:hypothetical protein